TGEAQRELGGVGNGGEGALKLEELGERDRPRGGGVGRGDLDARRVDGGKGDGFGFEVRGGEGPLWGVGGLGEGQEREEEDWDKLGFHRSELHHSESLRVRS